jgi:hypothetical protein
MLALTCDMRDTVGRSWGEDETMPLSRETSKISEALLPSCRLAHVKIEPRTRAQVDSDVFSLWIMCEVCGKKRPEA